MSLKNPCWTKIVIIYISQTRWYSLRFFPFLRSSLSLSSIGVFIINYFTRILKMPQYNWPVSNPFDNATTFPIHWVVHPSTRFRGCEDILIRTFFTRCKRQWGSSMDRCGWQVALIIKPYNIYIYRRIEGRGVKGCWCNRHWLNCHWMSNDISLSGDELLFGWWGFFFFSSAENTALKSENRVVKRSQNNIPLKTCLRLRCYVIKTRTTIYLHVPGWYV